MNYRNKLIICLITLSSTAGNIDSIITAQTNKEDPDPLILTLEQAIDHALIHSTEIKYAETDIEIAGKRINEITATGLPQVDASAGYQYYFDIPTSLVPAEFFGGQPGEFAEIQFGTEQTFNVSATLSQMLFDGSYIVGLRAARIYRELAMQNKERTELDVRNQVSETYFLILLIQDNLFILEQNISNINRSLYETEKTLEEGFTDPINVDQLRLALSNIQNRFRSMERQYEFSLNLLKFQIGLDINKGIMPADSLSDVFNRMMLEADTEEVFRHETHIDYRIMLSRQDMDLMALRREQSFFLPRLTASYTYQEMAMRNDFNFTDMSRPWFPTSLVALNLSIPIFSGGMRSAKVQQAKMELSKTEMAVQQVSESLRLQILDAELKLRTAKENYLAEKENLELAEKILERTTIMYSEGMATSLELTQANEQILTTLANYYSAMFDFVTSRNNLIKARGLK